MTGKKYEGKDCVRLLLSKRQELLEQGIDRLPQRSDFENEEVVAIKAFLGPWPRALEKAGIKEPQGKDRLEKNREMRRRIRRRAREARKKENVSEVDRDE